MMYKKMTIILIALIIANILGVSFLGYTLWKIGNEPRITFLGESIEEEEYIGLFRVDNLSSWNEVYVDLYIYDDDCGCFPERVDTENILVLSTIDEFYEITFLDLEPDMEYRYRFRIKDKEKHKDIYYYRTFHTERSSVGIWIIEGKVDSVELSMHDFIKHGADIMGMNIKPVALNNREIKSIEITGVSFIEPVRLWLGESVTDMISKVYFHEQTRGIPLIVYDENIFTYFIIIEPFIMYISESYGGEGDVLHIRFYSKDYYKITVNRSVLYDPETTAFIDWTSSGEDQNGTTTLWYDTNSDGEIDCVTFTLKIDTNATFIEDEGDDC